MTPTSGPIVRTTAPATLALALALAAAPLLGCGGNAKVAPTAPAPPSEQTLAPMADADREPRTVEEAQDRIAEARAELEGGAATADEPPSVGPTSKPGPAGGAAPAPEREAWKAAEDGCVRPCRALASMKRAVESLCRMTGDSDDRCVEARRTLADSTSRTASCKCDDR